MPKDWSLSTPQAYQSTTRADRAVARLAAREWSVLSIDELRACGLSDRKTEYIADLAQHFADGTIHVHRWPEMDDEEIIERLTTVRGVGRWTVEMLLLFRLDYGARTLIAPPRPSSPSRTSSAW